MGNPTDISREVQRAFFGRFGGKLRPVQALAFEELRDHCDALVMAQTGSGKTEAVLAPVAWRLVLSKQAGQTGLRAILLSPTRALATDLHRRVAGSFATLGLRMDVATSDYRSIGKTPTDILIRTPEGLEGDLFKNPEQMRGIRDVVIDELHKFLDSPRGTQLCGELARLSSIAPEHRRLGISATVEDTSVPGRCGILRSPLIIRDPTETGQTEVVFFDWLEEDTVAAKRLIRQLRALGVRKAIGFVKRRTLSLQSV